jgi:CBS domain-containing protein
MATVREIMHADPVTVRPDDDLDTVVRALRQDSLTAVPVVNEGGRCIGVVTESDLVIGDESGDLHLPHFIELFGGVVFLEPLRHFEDRLRKAVAATAQELMTEHPITVEADASVQEAAKVIARSHHDHLPVVEHGRLVGVVTRLDVLEYLAHDDE